MKKQAEVYNNIRLAGYLARMEEGYVFQYESAYLNDPGAPAISISLPKRNEEYRSKKLFPFFFGLLSEGVNKQTQCRLLRIDENDHFSLLLKTAKSDTIGAITVKPIE